VLIPNKSEEFSFKCFVHLSIQIGFSVIERQISRLVKLPPEIPILFLHSNLGFFLPTSIGA
jgi:hypothetical protein